MDVEEAPDREGGDVGGHDAAIARVIDHVRAARGVDLAGYKPATLQRRIAKRLQVLHLDTYENYLDHLQAHPDEYPRLFDAILINVTDFFRDTDAWEKLDQELLPKLLSPKHEADPVRVWSAGCSSGEEAYSVAMLLIGHLGEDGFRDRVKIYATDVDDDALAQARSGVYREDQLTAISPEQRERFFEPVVDEDEAVEPAASQIRADLRRSIIFGRHDVLQDPPISRLDLLLCRNTLMYFNADVQARALFRFHFALRDSGLLFLGSAEKLLNHPDLFEPVDSTRRFFTKASTHKRRRHPLASSDHDGPGDLVTHLSANVTLRDAALDGGKIGRIAIDRDGQVAIANAAARSMFQIEARDLGRPLQDLEVSYRPAELRAAIDRATETGEIVELRALEWRPTPGEPRYLDIDVLPLRQDDVLIGTLVTFTDATERHRLSRRLTATQRELEAAQLDLQTSGEELETMNEELQSTVEELETTNEELRSTNEELETMNEELQATNDELHTANEELVHRGQEVDEVNAFMGAVLRSFRRAVVVVDTESLVRVWNEETEDLWGLRSSEVSGQHLLNLDIGLPLAELHEPLRRCFNDPEHREELQLDARNRRGMEITCNVVMSSLVDGGSVLGAILLMEEQRW